MGGYYDMQSLETASHVGPLRLSLISFHASLATTPTRTETTNRHCTHPPDFLIHCNLGHLHRSVRICLKITSSISLEG